MDGYAFSSCDLARLATDASLTEGEEAAMPSEERIRINIIQVCPHKRLRAGIVACLRVLSPANVVTDCVRAYFDPILADLKLNLTTVRAQLESSNPGEVAAAAEFLFERAHTSHIRSGENKEQMRRDGAIPVLFAALGSPARGARFHACSALSELAFRNELNCMAISQSEGGLEAIVEILNADDVALKEDALLVVNNCAAFCEDVCTAIVSCPGMLDAIKLLVHVSAAGASSVAVGTMNCLSRCIVVQQVLLHAGVLEALLPVVRIHDSGDKHEAHIARATMAIANLTEGNCEGVFETVDDRNAALATTVKILSKSMKGENWAGINFAPYSVVYPLSNLALSGDAKEVLMELGLADQLSQLIQEWKLVGHQSTQTLELALHMTENLCETQNCQASMRAAGMMQALDAVLEGTRGQNVRVVAQAARILNKMTEGHVAFSMGYHTRLGVKSPLFQLDELILGKIAKLAFGCAAITSIALHSDNEQATAAAAPDERTARLNAALARMQHSGQMQGGGSPVRGLRRMNTLL